MKKAITQTNRDTVQRGVTSVVAKLDKFRHAHSNSDSQSNEQHKNPKEVIAV